VFIKVVFHPHSGSRGPNIIHLDAPNNMNEISELESSENVLRPPKPWGPFRTLADFEYAESAVTGCLSKKIVNLQLQGMATGWAEKSNITFKTHNDMVESLKAAREYGVKVRSLSPSISGCGHFKKTTSFRPERCQESMQIGRMSSSSDTETHGSGYEVLSWTLRYVNLFLGIQFGNTCMKMAILQDSSTSRIQQTDGGEFRFAVSVNLLIVKCLRQL
jgi:hypothetical protein